MARVDALTSVFKWQALSLSTVDGYLGLKLSVELEPTSASVDGF